ncbi:MAG: hypothetical protein GY910_25430 [bacterium]|nr:hypothetical protein [Deltaproteobacteria bacterium]MCP4908330.1 hypothetical protein [bacterium]
MAIAFPSLDFFEELARRMESNAAEFEKLGFCDTVMGIKVDGDSSHLYSLTFDVFDCSEVRELSRADDAELDFLLEAPLPLWKEMFESIQKNGRPDPAYTLNSLSHVGDRMRVVYDDPEGHDKFYRFMATIQAFVDQASDLEIAWA